MIVGVHHVAISVPDLERGLAFYRDQLGFEVVQRSEFDGTFEGASRAIGLANVNANMAMLKAPNCFVELWEYHHPVPQDRTARPCDYGYPHMALQVHGIAEECQRLKDGGMTFVGELVDFGTASAIYGQDPFGNVIELYEIRDPDIAQLAASPGST
jgi:catechol 2,3-dioxygenase-like lactoylglutathione lyase family enzyme